MPHPTQNPGNSNPKLSTLEVSQAKTQPSTISSAAYGTSQVFPEKPQSLDEGMRCVTSHCNARSRSLNPGLRKPLNRTTTPQNQGEP